MNAHDGGPAFPCHTNPLPGKLANAPQGMSLRDWFAGMALSGIMANSKMIDSGSDDAAKWAADLSLRIADAMIASRGGKEESK